MIHDASGEVMYTIRVQGSKFRPPVYREGTHSVKIGRDEPDKVTLPKLESREASANTWTTVAL
ncbi:MAG: hypothetical protein JJ992_29835 [Planctomycetes bacterium]|nr:hypothetical protein [Planctomycetota bacterium]